jgi:hypothetical protein
MEIKFSADPRIKGATELVQATPLQANSGSFPGCVGQRGRLSQGTLEMAFSTRSWNEKSVGEVDAEALLSETGILVYQVCDRRKLL